MGSHDTSDTTFAGSTGALGKALLGAPVMRPWPPALEEACKILTDQPYEVLGRIGHGGMGAVFQVRNLEPGMDRLEAVKIRRPEARDDDQFRERFLREISILSNLRHPGITTVFRSGDSAEGYLWFSMEFLDGQSLAELLAPGMPALAPGRVLDITRQLCITLQFIHKAGRLHRDLKPANVMVCEDGSVRLLDFGIARVAEPSRMEILTRPAEPASASALTRAGENPHTPDYAAPEQKNGNPVDERTDLYGLGRIVNEMIRPAAAGSSHPSQPRFSPRLLDLVDDLLAYARDDRPRSASAVSEKLDQLEPGATGFWGNDRSPFRGLQAYQPEHAEIFFGRDAAICRGLEIVCTGTPTWNGFCMIIGGSGSGKSSLARAGLGPALLRGNDHPERPPNSAVLIICDLSTLGPDDECMLPPLARCLASAIPAIDPLELVGALRHAGADLTSLLGLASGSQPVVQLCLILDQFEHLFRSPLPRGAQSRFLAAINRLARTPGVAVLATLRSDFYHHCAAHPVLMDLKDGHQLDLTPAQPWELAAMLRHSARAANLKFETLADGRGLDDILLDHARQNPESLPLLSYMLDQLWERRDQANGLLRVSDYEILGGFAGAVAAKATDTFDRFREDYPENPDESLDKLFQLVVEMSDSSSTPTLVRRLATREELAATDPVVRSLADRLVAARLFVTSGTGEASSHGLTLAHECLLRVWPRAIAWAEHNRDFLRTRARIASRMNEGSPLLAGDVLLESAKGFLSLRADAFTAEQIHYVREAAGVAENQARRNTNRRRLAFTGLSVLSVLALIGGAIAWQMKSRADEQSALANEQRAAAEAQRVQVTRQRDQQEALLWTASRGDHQSALRAADEQKHPDCLAYFERALRHCPTNAPALQASAAHAYGINAPAWHTRSIAMLESKVWCVIFSPDGRYLAMAGGDRIKNSGDLLVIEVTTGRNVCKVALGKLVRVVRFSPDGRYLAMGSEDCSAQVIETATGKEISKVMFGGGVNSLSFSPDGRFFVAGSFDMTARVIEAMTGKEIHKLAFESWVSSVDFSPDGRYFIAGSADRTAQVIDVATGKIISKVEFVNGLIAMCFSPDGQHIATGGADGAARVIETTTGKELSKVTFGNSVTAVSFSPDGIYLAAGGGDRTVRVTETATGREISKAVIGTAVSSVSFSPDGRHLAVGSFDRTARVIEVRTGKEISRMEFGDSVLSVSFSPDGRYLAAGSQDRTVRLMEAATGNEIHKVELGGFVYSFCFSPDGHHLAVGSRDHTARVIDVTTGQELCKVDFGADMYPVIFSPNGRYFATGSSDRTARVMETMTGKVVSKLIFGDKVQAVCFSPDGRHLAAGSKDKTVRVFEVSTGKVISKMEFDGHVIALSFSPNGRYLAAGSHDRTVRVMETTTGNQTSKAKFGNVVSSVSFSPDGRYLAAGSTDQTARVLEAMTGKEINKVEFEGPVFPVSFSPDGRHLAAGSSDRTVRVLEAVTGKEISKVAFCDIVGAVNFSPDGRNLAVGCSDQAARVIDSTTGNEISNIKIGGIVRLASFSADGRYFAAGSQNGTARVMDCAWFNTREEISRPWRAALRIQSGIQFQSDGKLTPLSAVELLAAQSEVNDFINTEPKPNERWQYAILKWSRMRPEERTTSPWTDEPIRTAVGRRLMRMPLPDSIDITEQAPWHPLVPVATARMEPRPDGQTDAAARKALQIRPRFLARLTLNRLRAADENLYGRDTLAGYATWAAMIMHDELQLDPEAREALTFALERTPKDQQQQLLKCLQSANWD